MHSKKAQWVGPTMVFIVIIALLFIAWLIIYSQRECHSNADCDADAYCGADFTCNKYPQITQTIRRSDFTGAAFLVGLAIVAAAVILRRKQKVPSENIAPKVIHTKDDHDEHAHTPHSHHPEEHTDAKVALEKFEKNYSKDSQSMEKYGEDAHVHTPKHR